jgi:murein DD-endopeptidase MepM/ murein hydrolase activator NlpD
MKRELEIVHEYQADEMAYSKSFYNSTYVESLISISSNNRPHLFSSPFSYNQLKNRIIMMNKIKANKPMRLTKIALSLSLSVVIISAFSFQLIEHPTNKEYPTIITTSKDHVPSIIPIPRKYKPELRSGYGHRIEPIYKTKKMHKGVDFVAPKGSSIVSTANGTVEEVGNNEGYGIHVKIKHGKTYETFYAHMSKALVKKGETLKQGDEIGIIGTTGRSTGIHLHYEVLENGENVDPALFLPVQKKN